MLRKILSKKIVKTLFGVLLLVGVGYGVYIYKFKPAAVATTAPIFTEQRVSRGDIVISFAGDGTAELPVVNLDFGISGKLKTLNVKVGQQIKKGEVVATLDDKDYAIKLQQAKIQYTQTLANSEKTKQSNKLSMMSEKQKLTDLTNQLKQINDDYLPLLEMEKEGAATVQELRLKKAAYDSAKQALDDQKERYKILSNSSIDQNIDKANIESQRLALQTAQNNLDATILTAPINAKVILISYKPGETLQTASKKIDVTTADSGHVMVISDAKKIEVTVPIAEVDLSNVSIGQQTEVTFEAVKGQIFSGKVVSIDSLPIIDSTGLVTYKARIDLDEGLDQIKTGMTCSISFILAQRRNVLVVPNKSVSIVDGKQVVQVKDDKGKVTPTKVTTGLTDGTNVEVIKGLTPRENILVNQ